MINDSLGRCRAPLLGLLALIAGGCASIGAVLPAQYATHRAAEYPVGIVTALYVTVIDIPRQQRGRAYGALQGAWREAEWAGADNRAGGHFSPSSSRRNIGSTFGSAWPSHYLHYPIRPPAADSEPRYWEG